jgi:KaiC/GvpD/RAD55 family RecA-like ATPase
VIDSITPLANFPITSSELAYFGLLSDVDRLMLPSMQEDLIVRMQVHKLVMVLKDLKCTSIITSEIPRNSEWLSSDHASEFLADGLILLKYLGAGPSMTRSLTIEKMRATKHAEDLMPLSITQRGLVVRKPEDVYKA